MDKNGHISYWKKSFFKSWIVSNHLFEKSDFVESLFFAHLAVEKLIKAHWVKDNVKNIPPRTHNIRWLVEQTALKLTPDQINA